MLLSAARNDPGARRSVTDDVRALARVPVAARLVPAAVRTSLGCLTTVDARLDALVYEGL